MRRKFRPLLEALRRVAICDRQLAGEAIGGKQQPTDSGLVASSRSVREHRDRLPQRGLIKSAVRRRAEQRGRLREFRSYLRREVGVRHRPRLVVRCD
jgi:hypothetical protein